MKRIVLLILLFSLLLIYETSIAAKARSISTDNDSIYHSAHLKSHLGESDCSATGNYIKVRSKAGENKVVGHLEQADRFILLEIENNWAKIKIIHADNNSPDSWNGLIGWVDSDYIDCTCSSDSYHLSTSYYCKTNNLRIRSKPVNGEIIGHLEKADRFIVHTFSDGWANITITYSADSSPDSWVGLTGWISTQYIEQHRDTTFNTAWKAAYKEYITSNNILQNVEDTAVFWLAYIDNDSIPELIIDTRIVAGGCHVLTYHNNTIDSILIGSTGTPAYIETGNLLLDSAGHQGCYYDTVYTIENGRWKQVFHAEHYELFSPQHVAKSNTIYTYHIDGLEVTKDKYYAKLNSHFKLNISKKLINGTSIHFLYDALL